MGILAHWIINIEQVGDIQIERPTDCSECDFSEYKAERYKFCPMCGKEMTEENETFFMNTDWPKGNM